MEILDICLQVTGKFEGGVPRYDTLAGNFDGAGMSAGILQWNVLSGTLQKLVGMVGIAAGWDKVNPFFKTVDMSAFARLKPADGLTFIKKFFLDPDKPAQLTADAHAEWQAFLNAPDTIAAQRALATSTTLAHALRLAQEFAPENATRSRVIAFFFDLVTQEGSMKTLEPAAVTTGDAAILFAETQDALCAKLWKEHAAGDALAGKLLYYAYERAKLGRADYIWPNLARRGIIACRAGYFEKAIFDLTKLLD